MKKLLALVASIGFAAASHLAAAQAAPPAFSSTLRVGDTLYVSGTLGTDASGKPAADAEAEAAKVMDNVKAAVEKAGMTMDDMVSVTVFCTDLNLYAAFNKVYVTYFHTPYPTRAFIGAKDLLRGAHFEVEGIAVKDAGKMRQAVK